MDIPEKCIDYNKPHSCEVTGFSFGKLEFKKGAL